MTPLELRFDVSNAVDLPGNQELAGWLFAPPNGPTTDSRLLVCVPGATYGKAYYHFEPVRFPGYSMAEHLVDAGHVVLVLDHLGVGDSTVPHGHVLLTPETVATANHAAATQALEKLRTGTLHHAVPPLPGLRAVGVGHSMGAMVMIIQQSMFATYEQLAILGWGNVSLAVDGVQPPMVEPNPAGYDVIDRLDYRYLFHLDDVPAELIEADDVAAVPVPTHLFSALVTPGITTSHAKAINVPVFVALGERDLSPDPYAEPSTYTNSGDVTLFVLPGSAHCHNFATSRRLLWDRLVGWIPSVG